MLTGYWLEKNHFCIVYYVYSYVVFKDIYVFVSLYGFLSVCLLLSVRLSALVESHPVTESIMANALSHLKNHPLKPDNVWRGIKPAEKNNLLQLFISSCFTLWRARTLTVKNHISMCALRVHFLWETLECNINSGNGGFEYCFTVMLTILNNLITIVSMSLRG